MFKFDNSHIFTGYLKQLLASFNLPMCKIYTKEFEAYENKTGKADPRVIESTTAINGAHYLIGNELYKYACTNNRDKAVWKKISTIFYDTSKSIPGLTKTLNSRGINYDTTTHEYLGDYLRFLRDYYDVNLMSLYNCFNNKICNNIYYQINSTDTKVENTVYSTFDSQDNKYRIYAFPVKLFSKYTIAIDSVQGIEMFCGFYNNTLDLSKKATELITKTYKKVNKTFFNQPFIYDKLTVDYWNYEMENDIIAENAETVTRWDIYNRERDLKLFIKIPASCKSSITVLEGDYLRFNDARYIPKETENSYVNAFEYQSNHSIINFEINVNNRDELEDTSYPLISKLQLLEFNVGESFPFADRLIEYLSGSVITPIDEIHENVERTQRVMQQNKHYFKITGLWEDKMQKIIYDYLINAGPIETFAISTQKDDIINYEKEVNPKTYKGTFKYVFSDKHTGRHPKVGYVSKSTLYDVLGYVDKDAEKWYASWTIEDNKPKVETIQNVDIYNGLYNV